MHRLCACLGVTLLGVLAVAADETQPAAMEPGVAKALAQRAAAADAYHGLLEAAAGLSLGEGVTVATFVAESDQTRAALKRLVATVKPGEPTWAADGSCCVTLTLPIARVADALGRARPPHTRVSSEALADLPKAWPQPELTIIGRGTARPDLPVGLPASVLNALGPVPTGSPEAAVPERWMKAGPQARFTAHRAAVLDAQRQLAMQIQCLHITSEMQVGDLLAERDLLVAEIANLLSNEQPGETYLADDALVCQVVITAPVQRVVEIVKQLLEHHGAAAGIADADAATRAEAALSGPLVGVGYGTPDPRFAALYAKRGGQDLPEWAAGSVVGQAEATPESEHLRQRGPAARAAEAAARKDLAGRIGRLEFKPGRTVQQAGDAAPDVAARLAGLVARAAVVQTNIIEGRVQVRVEVPGLVVWEIATRGASAPQ